MPVRRNNLPPIGRPKGGRLGSRKEKTGCITCKRRKIKCDEAKPHCFRCTSTGRECDGYVGEPELLSSRHGLHGPGTYSHAPDLLYQSAISGNTDTPEERRAVDNFTQFGAITTASWTDMELWSRLIPQRSHTEPAIRYAMISMGWLLLSMQHPAEYAARKDGNLKNLALQSYGKAIQATLRCISQGRGDVLLSAMTCVLFFSIEALQGHEKEAVDLFGKGRKAMELQLQLSNHPQSGTMEEIVRAYFEPLFTRMAIQCAMFGIVPPASWDDSCRQSLHSAVPNPRKPIRSIMEAGMELSSLASITQSIIVVGARVKWEGDSIPTPKVWPGPTGNILDRLRDRQKVIDAALENWYERFFTFQNAYRRRPRSTRGDTIVASALVQHYTILRIWLGGSLVRDEMIYDDFHERFCWLVREAEASIALAEQDGGSMSFAFEMGVIPGLYITINKCRDSKVRHQALDLLRRAPLQGGPWNRDSIVRIAGKVIELEESGLDRGSDASESSASFENLIPEHMRIKRVKIHLRTVVDGIPGYLAEFVTLPNGLEGDWCITREFFDVHPVIQSK
ncbi:hypothetical protein F5Y15DRAFT_415785 [Xylariaceae sp. FL0016]|nr:hypothetical protein F5Y15DRAFT_415785 [Xylariaceae sp. FL0016]